MTFDFLDRRSAERFAELLDEAGGGPRHHMRDGADAELAELVAVGQNLSAARTGVRVDPEFRVGLRAMLVATAERDGIGRTAAGTEPVGGHAAVREPRLGFLGRGSGRRFRARGAIVIGVAAGAMAVSGISAASENAAPGDALYGVKRSTERAQLAMAGSDVTRGQLALDFARNRLVEAATLADSGAFAGVLNDMDADTRQGVKLLNGSAVARKETAPLDQVDSFVTAQKRVFSPMLDELTPANRKRAETSLALLDDVDRRAASLRTGLACDQVRPDGQDSLGPRLSGCMTGTDATAPDEQPTGQGEPAERKKSKDEDPDEGTGDSARSEPEPSETAADPDPTGRTIAPGDEEPATDDRTPRAPAPAPAGSAPAEPGSTQEKGLLGGVLGGIFG